jgi:hypothetical protein
MPPINAKFTIVRLTHELHQAFDTWRRAVSDSPIFYLLLSSR